MNISTKRMMEIIFLIAAATILALAPLQTVKIAAVERARAQSPGAVVVEDVNFRQLAFIVKGTADDQRWIYVYSVRLNKSAFAFGETAELWEANRR